MEDIITLKLFYPMLFTTIVIISVVLICAVKSGFQFKTHVDEHIDTTDKFSKSHTEVVSGLPIVYHKEIHNLEKEVKNTNSRIIELAKEINEKMDLLVERVTKLENKP